MFVKPDAIVSRQASRSIARNAERLRSCVLGVPKRAVRGVQRCSAMDAVSGCVEQIDLHVFSMSAE